MLCMFNGLLVFVVMHSWVALNNIARFFGGGCKFSCHLCREVRPTTFHTNNHTSRTRKSPESLGFSHRKSTHELYHFVST